MGSGQAIRIISDSKESLLLLDALTAYLDTEKNSRIVNRRCYTNNSFGTREVLALIGVSSYELRATVSIQKTTFMTCVMTSSGDQISNKRGTMGAAVAAANRETSFSPKGTIRISCTTP